MENKNEQKETNGLEGRLKPEDIASRIKIQILKPHSNGKDKIIMGEYNGIEFTYLTINGIFESDGVPENESAALLDYLKSKYNPKPENSEVEKEVN